MEGTKPSDPWLVPLLHSRIAGSNHGRRVTNWSSFSRATEILRCPAGPNGFANSLKRRAITAVLYSTSYMADGASREGTTSGFASLFCSRSASVSIGWPRLGISHWLLPSNRTLTDQTGYFSGAYVLDQRSIQLFEVLPQYLGCYLRCTLQLSPWFTRTHH